MATHSHEERLPKKGIRDDAQLGIWLGLLSFTFFFAVFIVSNVYLRGWSPNVFNVELPAGVQDFVNYNAILLFLAGVFTLIGGIGFKKRANGMYKFNLFLALLSFIAYFAIDYWLIQQYRIIGPAAWTAYVAVQSFMAILALISIVLYVRAFYFVIRGREASLTRFIPAATSVWIYTVVMGWLVFIQCDLISIGQFTQWCGTKMSLLTK
ncbi:hypothetical protein [Aneurinibacillus terranovensis]|uniref:hypothetical protein n=1 Tax=Aneurinibacillus terranovensis TaxID=278991 RepID=UPI000404303E|nr:hypothetical protein [Aneurinibacillus terranovensis]